LSIGGRRIDLNAAVRAVREVHESQQAFATRLGISISGIANYEKNRTPPLSALLALSKLSRNENVPASARAVIQAAAREELRRNIGEEDEFIECPAPGTGEVNGGMVLTLKLNEVLYGSFFRAAIHRMRKGGEEGIAAKSPPGIQSSPWHTLWR